METIETTNAIEEEEKAIEDEEGNLLDDPFDPESISIDSKTVAMETCLRRLTQGTIILDPDFQRNEVWTNEKKSQLIESIMFKIPLPMFYMSADEKANYTVVDGLQRLSTIRDFILGKEYLANKEEHLKGNGFRLQNMEFWKEFEGKTFNELPTFLRNRILETEFTFTIINPGTPEEVKRNIFKRINTGGMPLSAQEIRNALYGGKTTQILKELAESKSFKNATGWTVKVLRMEDKELILRFLAFLVRDYTTFKKSISIDTFLSDTMLIINAYPEFQSKDFKKMIERGNVKKEDINLPNIAQIETLFELGMERSYKLFGEHCFRKSYEGKRKTPLNKSLFEMWGVFLSQMSEKDFETLLAHEDAFMEDYKKIIDDAVFHLAISRDSMKPTIIQDRFTKIKNLIETHTRHDN